MLSVNNNSNKPWKNESFHTTFEEADYIRSKLLRIWKLDEKYKGMQVKVKWSSANQKFVVKTRIHPDFELAKQIKETKNNGKGKRRNQKNSSRGESDTSSVV